MPFEALYEHKPDLKHLQVLGCKCFVHIPKHLCQKFGAKTFQAILVGYDANSKACGYYDMVCHRIIINRDVVFLKDSLGDFANAEHHDNLEICYTRLQLERGNYLIFKLKCLLYQQSLLHQSTMINLQSTKVLISLLIPTYLLNRM